MISKDVFLERIEYLQALFNHELTEKQMTIYYDKLSADMSDTDFLKQVDAVIESEFRFPPIAAFYKGFEKCPPMIVDEARRSHLKRVLGDDYVGV